MFSDKESFKKAFTERLESQCSKRLQDATAADAYRVVGGMVREHIARDWLQTNDSYLNACMKQAYYFSMEFLLGRLLQNNLLNLGMEKICAEGLKELGFELQEVQKEEHDAGLGNGGLGRLAACFLDSLASLGIPGHGCGIRYKYGLFKQKIIDGYQVELPEDWLSEGNVWEIRRPDQAVEVRFRGHVRVSNTNNKALFIHEDYETVLAVPYDVPVIGYKNGVVNTLQLWSAETLTTSQSYTAISELLYPDDSHYEGRLLRLKQEYFLVSAALQNLIAKYKKRNGSVTNIEYNIAIHLNDTHPVLAIPELMRILIDQEGLHWEQAWGITTKVMSYTNHTTLSEALEKWSEEMLRTLLPRIYMLINEINERFCAELWKKYPGQWDKISRLAIKCYGYIRMAPLAIVGSHLVNGVSKVHTQILKTREMQEYNEIYPEKFINITNGVSHRRWLLGANPLLANLITEVVGCQWVHYPIQLKQLCKHSGDAGFQEEIMRIKRLNKEKLAQTIKQLCGVNVDTASIFDVQVKRLHLYKRQLLNILHIIDLYNQLNNNPSLDIVPRTFIFGAKAAPGYYLSKKVIKLINTLADKVNNDRRINEKLKIIFLEDYRVTLAEEIIPAADVSEQISTAGKEASGTGNMKFMMNGAITLATLDGANIEIKEAVGEENIFSFGLTADEVNSYLHNRNYNAWDLYYSDARLKMIIDQIQDGFFPIGKNEFDVIYNTLLNDNDEFFVLKDFASYVNTQKSIDTAYRNSLDWSKMCIENIACSGKFSSDYTIEQYAKEIWGIHSIHDKDVLTENDSHCIIKN